MNLARELRHALRRLSRRPLLALSAVAVLTLGIGANTAIFSVLQAVLLRPLPVPDAERLVYVREQDPDGSMSFVGYETYLDLAERMASFESVAVASQRDPVLSGPQGARTLDGLGVTASWLPTLGIEPVLGRNFTTDEDRPGAPRAVLLGHALWQSAFASDPGIVGRTVELSDIPFGVVGVLPAALDRLLGPGTGKRLDVVVPLRYAAGLSWACRSCRHLNAIARLRPGVDRSAATAELSSLLTSLRSAHPDSYPTDRGVLPGLGDELRASSRELLWSLFAGVVLVLLLATMNVAALLAVRALERQRELAILRSLGAGRSRLVATAFVESLLIALAGAFAGVTLARPLLRALIALAPGDIPRLDGAGLSLPVLAFTAATALVIALLGGVAPAIAYQRASARSVLAAGATAGMARRRRLRLSALVVAEMALALVVVFAAGLVGRSLSRLEAEDTGFEPRQVVVADVAANGAAYDEVSAINEFFDRAVTEVEALPGVTAAGWTSQLPLAGNLDSYGLRFADRPEMRLEEEPSADRYAVSPGYFRALGVRLVAGRFFADSDETGAPEVALVSRKLAEAVWPGESALGKRLQAGGPDAPWRTIVGVVEDVLHRGLDSPSQAQFYVPASQWQWGDSSRVLVVRSTLPPGRLAKPIAAAIARVDPACPVEHFAKMEQIVADSAGGRRFASAVWGSFALLAMLLAATGTFGLLSRQVALRRRELGVRAALGAAPARLVGELGREVIGLVAAALAVAIPASLALGRLLASQLWRIDSGDPATLAWAAALVGSVALAAASSPALRAARTDPSTTLREDG